MYPIIINETAQKFYFDCRKEKHPYYFYPLFRELLTRKCRKQCFLPSIQMKMLQQQKKKYLKLKFCTTRREFDQRGEVYYLILVFEIITMDIVHEKSNFFYMLPLQVLDLLGDVISDITHFPEIVVSDISNVQADVNIACVFLCAVFTNSVVTRYNNLEIDDDLLSRLKYCDKIYKCLINKEKINKIDFEHLILYKSTTCVKENLTLFFTTKLIKFVKMIFKMVEFYKKVYYKHEKELGRYGDGQSIFIAFDPFSKQSLLYRAKPVAMDSRNKFLFQFPLSLHNDHLNNLCDHLSAISKKPRDGEIVFLIVVTVQNGKRRLVLKTEPSYGNLVLSYQKAKDKISDHEPTFDDNAGFVDLSDDEMDVTGNPCLEFEDEKFAQFQFQQSDKLESIVKRLRLYLLQLVTNKVASSHLSTESKKEKTKGKREKKQVGSTNGKKRTKKIESDDEIEETLVTTPPALTSALTSLSSGSFMPYDYGVEIPETVSSSTGEYGDDNDVLDKKYIMSHLDFFIHLYMLKKQYEEVMNSANIVEYMDIIYENKDYFDSVDGGVLLNLLENNKENIEVLLNSISDIINQVEIHCENREYFNGDYFVK